MRIRYHQLYIVRVTNITKSFTNDTYREVFCNIANINRRYYQRTIRALFTRYNSRYKYNLFREYNRVVVVAHKASQRIVCFGIKNYVYIIRPVPRTE